MKKNDIILELPCDLEIVAENCEHKYWIGRTEIADLPFHVELVEVKVGIDLVGGDTFTAKNADFQNRIDAWLEKNEGERPRLFKKDRKTFFVHVEVYAE